MTTLYDTPHAADMPPHEPAAEERTTGSVIPLCEDFQHVTMRLLNELRLDEARLPVDEQLVRDRMKAALHAVSSVESLLRRDAASAFPGA